MLLTALCLLAASGCATEKRVAGRYFQLEDIRVAIIPAKNNTDKVAAPIVLDKIWEERLTKDGFIITNADSVVTYASATGITLEDMPNIPVKKLGADLDVDYLLFNEIVDWGSSYHVLSSRTVVACRSRLIEARTGAAIWEHDWVFIDQSSDGGGGIVGAAIGAAVHSLMGSMFDAAARAAANGINYSSHTMPYPGFAPAPKPGTAPR
jgi:hypothetical protein